MPGYRTVPFSSAREKRVKSTLTPKLSDLKYKGYDIHREKSDIIGFHKDEYNYDLFWICSFDKQAIYS